jgi:hypothetical protein
LLIVGDVSEKEAQVRLMATESTPMGGPHHTNATISYHDRFFIPLRFFHTNTLILYGLIEFHTTELYIFIPNEVGFTPESILFKPKLNNSSLDENFTLNLRLMRTTQMAHTTTSKRQLGPVVCKKKKSASLSMRLVALTNTTLVCVPPSYNPLVLRSLLPLRIVSDPRVQKLAFREIRMTRVVGVRQPKT